MSRLKSYKLRPLWYLTQFLLAILFASTCFFFLFLTFDLSFLIPAVIAQTVNPTAEFSMPTGIPTKEATAEIKTHPVTAEAKTSKSSMKFKFVQTFLCFLSSFYFGLFLQCNKLYFHLYFSIQILDLCFVQLYFFF